VADTPLDVLATLDAGSWFDSAFKGEFLPGLGAAARICRELGLWANVEIKPSRGTGELTGRVAATAASDAWGDAPLPPLLSSFDTAALLQARIAAPHLQRALLFDAVPADWREQLDKLDCIALHCNAGKLNKRRARDILDAGCGLAVWTVNDPTRARLLFDWASTPSSPTGWT